MTTAPPTDEEIRQLIRCAACPGEARGILAMLKARGANLNAPVIQSAMWERKRHFDSIRRAYPDIAKLWDQDQAEEIPLGDFVEICRQAQAAATDRVAASEAVKRRKRA